MRKGFRLLGACLVALLVFAFSTTGYAKTIKIGVLVDLSGGLSTYGHTEKIASEIAEGKINKFFKEKGYPYKVRFYVEDTKCDPKVCLDKAQALYALGIKLMLGPMSSGEVKNLKNFVNSNRIIIMSPSSTAPPDKIGCARPKDKRYIFRLVPTDNFQGNAVGDLCKSLGFKNVVVIYRKDAWGDGLKQASVARIKKWGITLLDVIPYDPNIADWSPIIQKLIDDLKYKDPKNTGVVFIGFEEVASLLAQMKLDCPALNYTWIGTDGMANSKKILEEAKDRAIKVKFYSTMFHSVSDEAKELQKIYEKKGLKADQYALNIYDGAWIGAISYVEMLKEKGKYDADYLSSKIREVATKYSKGEYGVKPVTGTIKFNEWNDRASGNYAIFMVTEKGWVLGGIWHSETGEITWKQK
ncbi:Extracellular ligand-binding receptor [Thermodesulfatator indicus DSM 15286]|uniref:Extracellular ligand-binding receptor n=1 Tax=Thermodesulfatator indicus (strain DSM 15286 / JCM 11887 / CIR29812) TaxID=667014 RepID=F8AC81_THEID|nr:ABC transporter substrate-binding protein [Thermodesulfatator indicus]AEH45716.1 Extracellular ligand-binding receptor [Thermodesulfatator indicus DSM 15286]